MGFWDELWNLLGITTVMESLREKSKKKQGLEVKYDEVKRNLDKMAEIIEKRSDIPAEAKKQAQEIEINTLPQGGLQAEARNLYEILFNFVFYPKLKSFISESHIISSNKELINTKNLNEYNLIVNFVKKFGTEYSQKDFDNLKKLLHIKGIFLSEENILSLLLDEKAEQEYLNLKKIILEYNPVMLKDYLEFFVKNFNREINYLIKCKEGVNKFGIYYNTPHSGISIIESIVTEKVTTETFEKTTNLISLEYFIKQIILLARKVYFFKRLLLEKDTELYSKNIGNDENLFKEIIDTKNNYDLSMFEESLYHGKKIKIDEIDTMEGHEFERFLKTLFERMSYSVEHTKLTGDQGADLVISKLGEKTVVQAKRSNTKIGNGAIQEIVASINHYKVDKGMTVTNNFFTPSAVELAKSNKITLIDRDELNRLIKDFL